MQKKMDFSAKNRINSIVGCIYTGLDARIRRTYRYIRQRVQPFAENTFFAYVRQDATVLSGELANEENQGGVRRYWIFPQKKSPEGLIFDSFTVHFRDHPATIPRPSHDHYGRHCPVRVRFWSGFDRFFEKNYILRNHSQKNGSSIS